MKKNMGFTLAEVLISLTIIGVIAAITVPALIQRTNKQEYVSALQKTYSTLSQAANMIIAENGSPKSSCETCDDGWSSTVDKVYDLFIKNLNNVKECGKETNCVSVPNPKSLSGSTAYGTFYGSVYTRSFIMADGVQISIWIPGGNNSSCSKSDNGDIDICAIFRVDLNGAKKPNKWGRDVFQFILKEDKLAPGGCDNNAGNCKITGSGFGCACRVLREGAMNY